MNFNLAKLLIPVAIILSAPAFAEEGGTERSTEGTDKYGVAGCGLGALMFGDRPGAVQIFASTFNGSFGSQTFAISSGTSGCKIGHYEAAAFIDVNRVALAKDVVHGNGETLDSFAKLIGCPSQDLGPELKKNYDSVFNTNVDSKQTATAIIELIRAEPKLQACSAFTLG